MKPFSTLLFFYLLLLNPFVGWAYPLDGNQQTGIARLEGYRLAQEGKVRGLRLHRGALLNNDQVDLRLLDHPDLKLPPPDADFTSKVRKLLGNEADRYGISVLDLTNPEHPRLAGHRDLVNQNPGSVGKLMVALALFQALADIYPKDLRARERILRKSMVTATEFIHTDHHKVPFWSPKTFKLKHRPLKVGDRASLWTYLDWMLSASSNAAASMVIRELMLMVHFGEGYPLSDGEAKKFFRKTPRKELSALLSRALQDPIPRNGLGLKRFRQGSFFTWKGKRQVPGTSSRASAGELLKFLLRLEKGKIVDPFSSREIKRLLYMTQRRIRYASSPALRDAAVYFKSGSLYMCKPEAGFKCRKYHGNVVNLLNSVAIVESPASERRLYYMAVVMSNVLRKNSAVAHQTLATRLHRLIESYHRGKKVGAGKSRIGK